MQERDLMCVRSVEKHSLSALPYVLIKKFMTRPKVPKELDFKIICNTDYLN